MRSSSSTRNSWATFRREVRTASDLLLLVRICVFAALTPVLVRLELPTLARLLGRSSRSRPGGPERIDRITRFTDYALRVGRPLVRSRCLTRGITLCYFLRRAGLDVELCYGVGTPLGEFAGHCWLELDGDPYLEPRDPRTDFTATFRIPSGEPGLHRGRSMELHG
jgi:hypothetical protein